MVAEAGVVVAASAALAVTLYQFADHVPGAFGSLGALQAQPHQVHSQQAFALQGFAREDCLVADDDAMLVGAHLRAPQPERPAKKRGVSPRNLRDVDPGAAQR